MNNRTWRRLFRGWPRRLFRGWPRRLFRGWRPALRIARREALHARGRSALVLVMVGLPVLAIVALDTLGRTSDVSVREGISRQIGAADAGVHFQGDTTAITQNPTMTGFTSPAEAPQVARPTIATVRTVLGPGSRIIDYTQGQAAVRTKVGVAQPDAVEVDLRDPMAAGLFQLTAGRLPRTTSEVVLTGRLASRGFPIGSDLTLQAGGTRHVVGLVESTTARNTSTLVGLPGSLSLTASDAAQQGWLVTKPGGVSWATVRQLNSHALLALSRSVVEHPPPPSAYPDQGASGGTSSAEIAVLALVVAMALLEVVLLAGPAFAVGARRQQRSLALIVAAGGEPPDIRRVVLASGLVLGSVAAVVGSVVGVCVAWLAQPGVQHFSTERLGPFQLSLRDISAIALCGFASAVLASLAPALLAAQHDVVAVLAGRRGETRTRLRSPILGAVLLGLGIAGAFYGAGQPGGETYITASAISAVLGMVLLIPVVVAQLGRVAHGLPLPARFAVRDAARHRSRTAPAVAAVAATVAGVVALGIGGSSDAARNRATYTPRAPIGAAVVTDGSAQPPDWSAIASVVRKRLPAGHITQMRGVVNENNLAVPATGKPTYGLDVQPILRGGRDQNGQSYASNFGTGVLVGTRTFRAMGLHLSKSDRARALQALSSGKVVVFASPSVAARITSVRLLRQRSSTVGNNTSIDTVAKWTMPAVGITAPGTVQPVQAVLSETALQTTGFAATTTALLVDGVHISTADNDALSESLTGVDVSTFVWVERGFHDNSTAVILLLLGCVGGALVLGGTLTATFLALSDARPDFATMGAVGAAPATRRTVAASYAATIGLVGAALGALVGFIPGIAVTYPLTSASWAKGSLDAAGAPIADHFIDVPWLMIAGLVVALPLLTAGIVGLATRARLPMVSRLS
jgi:putative ABC transport system permease protein